ncbi:MAG: DUF1893 domain-containing protein [Chloroflexi bacterium]|nr:DUF1893 domain-containing protein [Chloroflexota bacterium]MBM3175049.1 DUF1893 domain-containing protein [Chloroflexota bacterium]
MGDSVYAEFLESGDTLRVYAGDALVFSSRSDRLVPLLDYLEQFGESQAVVMMDKVVGNAAALLMVQADCRKVYSPLGSKVAMKTLGKWGVGFHFDKVVPYISRVGGVGMCPMEEMSVGKSPEEFLAVLRARFKKQEAG